MTLELEVEQSYSLYHHIQRDQSGICSHVDRLSEVLLICQLDYKLIHAVVKREGINHLACNVACPSFGVHAEFRLRLLRLSLIKLD